MGIESAGNRSAIRVLNSALVVAWIAGVGVGVGLGTWISSGNSDRRSDGITRPEFGDLIHHTLEGYQFIPSFWGRSPPWACTATTPAIRG
jgi:hypothetical protein